MKKNCPFENKPFPTWTHMGQMTMTEEEPDILSFDCDGAIDMAISALRQRKREIGEATSVEIRLEDAFEVAELSAAASQESEDELPLPEGGEEEGESLETSDDAPNFEEVDKCSAEKCEIIYSALEELGGMGRTAEVAELAEGFNTALASTYLSRMFDAGVLDRVDDSTRPMTAYIYIIPA